MERFRYVVVDVFSERPLAGNQLAVFTNAQPIPERLLQPLAKEIGFSETVFCYPAEAEGHVRIRIFTPASEIPFAGHPTLGTAFVLAAFGPVGINCFAGGGKSWKTRCFVSGLGISEDPATGSAAGPLALHLARHGAVAFGEEIEIRQGEEVGRPSFLYASAHGTSESIERVEVGGCAVVVARGEFALPGAR